jgi:hypothetical protein
MSELHEAANQHVEHLLQTIDRVWRSLPDDCFEVPISVFANLESLARNIRRNCMPFALPPAVGMERDRDELRRFRNLLLSHLRCPDCGMHCASLVDDGEWWNCDDCKFRWPVNAPALESRPMADAPIAGSLETRLKAGWYAVTTADGRIFDCLDAEDGEATTMGHFYHRLALPPYGEKFPAAQEGK